MMTQTLPPAPPGASTRSEHELLLCCVRPSKDAKTTKRLKILLETGIDWEYLIQTATNHGVMPLLYQTLSENCAKAVPEMTFTNLQEKFCANVGHNLALTSELLKILELLSAHDIPAIPFKGPVLSAAAYGNLSQRQFSDLDLLVQKCNFQKAKDLLVSQGYRLATQTPWETIPWEHHLISSDNAYNIDVHQELLPKHFHCNLNFDSLWKCLEPVTLAGTIVQKFASEVELLILCLNGAKECWRSLSRICDVAALIHANPDLNWDFLIDESTKFGCKRAVFLGLLLVRNLLEITLPESVLQKVLAERTLEGLAMQTSNRLFLAATNQTTGEISDRLFYIHTKDRLWDKIKIFYTLLQHSGWLTPTVRDRDVIPLPALLSFLYYLIRPIRVFMQYRYVLEQHSSKRG